MQQTCPVPTRMILLRKIIAREEKPVKLVGKRAVILVEDLYQELEVWYPLLRLREEGAEVLIVAPNKKAVYKSKLGYPIESTLAASEVDTGKMDAVIIPGGYTPDLMRRHPEMVHVVRQAFRLN